MAKRSFWAWGMETDEPNLQAKKKAAQRLSITYGVPLEIIPNPSANDLNLRPSRIKPPKSLSSICTTDAHERASHTYGRNYEDRIRAFNLDFPNPTDLVAYPRDEKDIIALLDWCSTHSYSAIPYGGGSSVVGGVEPPEDSKGIVTIDLSQLNRLLEVDEISRAARIQSGIYGPALDAQLRPYNFTLRHFPQSYEYSTLGGWIATRSGGHYATNHTHIDDFVESIRAITPTGIWESRRLPGSGAGPSPDRIMIGSEGIFGIITEAWMRVQARPRFRASAGVMFSSFEAGAEASRLIAQSKLWPANCRLLDPNEASEAAGLDGTHALLVIGFESSDIPQQDPMREAIVLARQAGGTIDDSDIRISDGSGSSTGRQGNVGEWRNSFLRAPYDRNLTMGLGIVAETLETAITWDKWQELEQTVRQSLNKSLTDLCGGGRVTCRFTHVYPDGPAPYFTFEGLGRKGSELQIHKEIKQAASEAIVSTGGTITHHHAVGRVHRHWYDKQRPDLFAQSLKQIKQTLDPNGILNPGILIDP